MDENLRGLYVITDDGLTPPASILQQVEAALRGGAKIVQLRDKRSPDAQIAETALALDMLCKEHGALFVLNDKVDMAVDLRLSCLHIGKSDHERVDEIRKKFDGCLGVSCYGDLSLAKTMQDKGVDYVAFGSFFHSPTKPDSNIIDLELLSRAKALLDIPVCAIGGLNRDNSDTVMAHQPDSIALISDIWKCDDIESRCRYYADFFKEEI
jgi:thiamine-phosphate pyrophosphorylase